MRTLTGLVLLLAPSRLLAAPAVCAPSEQIASMTASMTASGDTVTACFVGQATCIALGAKDKKSVPKPAAAPPPIEFKDGQVCAGATCKPLGKKLKAQVVKATAKAVDPALPGSASATADLAFVTIALGDGKEKDRAQLWNVAKDKRITVKAPAEYKKTGEKPSLGGFMAVGNFIEATWIACAGPCMQGVIVDASGANKGAYFPGGDGVALDEARVAIVPSEASGTVTIVEGKTGKHVGEVKLGDGTSAILREAVVKLAGDDFAALYDDGQAVKVSRFSAPVGKPVTTVWTQTLDACP